MRISDWSSDVCSSDLLQRFVSQGLILGTSNAIGFGPANLGNPNLKWETTAQWNAGLDVGFMNQRLRMSLDYYRKKTTDLLAVVNLPPNSGFATTLRNIGSRSEEHTSELQSLMRISYAVFCLKKKNTQQQQL